MFEKEAARLGAPGENKNNVEAALAELNAQTSTPDVAKDGDDENDVALVDSVAGDRSPPHEPTSVPSRSTTIVENGTTEAEVLRGAKAGTSEAEGSKTEPTPRGAMGRRGGRSGSRQIKKKKLPVEVAKAGRKLSPERMRTVLESLRENPILSNAANKAGIHPKGLAYWLKCSAAGETKYRLEWEGFELGFHEHCQIAIEEAYDKPQEAAWYIAMGTDLRDGDGEPVPQASWKQKGKMLRFLLEWRRSETYGNHRKMNVPQNSGVLVVGGIRHDIPDKINNSTAASVKARKWKAAMKIDSDDSEDRSLTVMRNLKWRYRVGDVDRTSQGDRDAPRAG